MFGGISRRFFLTGAASTLAGAALAEAPLRSLRPEPRPWDAGPLTATNAPAIEDLIARAALGGAIGFAVADAQSGALLESHQGDLALPPGSVAKTVTAEYARRALGADYRFATSLIATGPVANGRLDGDLVLAGGGDPTLDTDRLAALVAKAKGAGLREVTGRFLVWGGALPYVREIDPEQPDHVGYNPSVSGLNLNFNRVYFQWAPADAGWAVSMDARSDTLAPRVQMARMAVVARDLPTYTYRERDGVDEWTVASAALGKGGSRWLPVRQPARYAAEVVQALAASHGIRLKTPEQVATLPAGTVLAQDVSGTLDGIERDMLKYSTNIVAEALGLSATRARGTMPAGLSESAGAMTQWLQETFGASSARFEDHSGLGGGSRISAADMVRMLAGLGPASTLHSQMKTMPAVTLEGKADPNARHAIHAKTGTLNFVSALAGYVTPEGRAPLAFAIFCADVPRREALPPEQVERPDGGRAWSGRARLLQQQLINRWVAVYGA